MSSNAADVPMGDLLDADSADTMRLSAVEATMLGNRALRSIGYSNQEAAVIMDQLIDNALCGYKFAGLPRILAIARNAKTRCVRQPIKVVHETPAAALIDGGNNVGYLAASRGADVVIEKSRFCGLAAVGLYNTYYSGRFAYFVERIVNAGLVVLHAGSSHELKVLPPGGARPALSTNPISFGFPSSQGPVIFDIGTASMQGGDLFLHALLDKALPAGIAFDAAGGPTRDGSAALRGGVLPFGGHKGYGLSFCVQALGLLAGAALKQGDVRDYGFLFLAVRPDVLSPGGAFPLQMAKLVAEIKATSRQPGVDEIRIPYERAVRERARRRVEGIVIDHTVVDALNKL